MRRPCDADPLPVSGAVSSFFREDGKTPTIGLIINPIAGMGGSVALKGTDGEGMAERARALGAVPHAGARALAALEAAGESLGRVRWLTCSGAMGEDICRSAGLPTEVIGRFPPPTRGSDTVEAAGIMAGRGVDLLVFAGGDGTARDVATAVGETVPTLGIPGGVKIHSAVFAQSPSRAGELLADFVAGRVKEFHPAEVMDIDEEAFREGRVEARLFGYLSVPLAPRAMQVRKSGRHRNSRSSELQEAAEAVVETMKDGDLYFLGSGSTVRAVSERLDLEGTLLGVDAVLNGRLVGKDVTENEILKLIGNHGGEAFIVVSPIGGQGFLFGRGNQQFSPSVLRSVGKERIRVVATPDKMEELFGRPLLVDTGDAALDRELSGYYPVIIGYRRKMMCRVSG